MTEAIKSLIRYHIHIDAKKIASALYDFAIRELGFLNQNFSGGPSGYRLAVPDAHLTRKFNGSERKVFHETFNSLEKYINKSSGSLEGYIEGEFIVSDETIDSEAPINISTPVPFYLRLRPIRKDEVFRETELHLVLNRDLSNPTLLDKLCNSGLYPAYITKKDYMAMIFTAQGYRKDILPLMEEIRSFLIIHGGAVGTTMKEEFIMRYFLSGINTNDLPHIVDKVIY